MSTVILLSGGSGSRLWPLSNEARSKQFLKVLRDADGAAQSMVQRVVAQLRRELADVRLVIATSEAQVPSIEAQLDGAYSLVVEPERRDTAPAIMLAGAYLHDELGLADDEPLVVMPIDSFVDDRYFKLVSELEDTVRANAADIVLLGVKPTHPSSKFGYIVPREDAEENEGAALPVETFVEKPDQAHAEDLLARGALWNCGVFAFRLGYLRSKAAQFIDASSYEEMQARYSEFPKISFDYAVVEHASSISVVPYDGMWKDLGTWNTLTSEMRDEVAGRVITDGARGTYVINELTIPLVTLGINDAVVVATPDGILVADKDASANMKPYVQRAAEDRAMCEHRRWGEYRVLDHACYSDGARSLTKHLRIDEGCQISYQRHARRDEIWTIVDGSGEVALDGVVTPVTRGDSISIAAGSLHAIRALSCLQLVEVQIGAELTEEDIERFGFFWED